MVLNMAAPRLLPEVIQSPINCGAMAMIAGLVIVPVVSLFTKKPEEKFIEETFACYDEPRMASQKNDLGK